MKATKSEARYQDHPNGGQRCSRCSMFRPPQDCTAVMGRVEASGWCRYYAPSLVKALQERRDQA